MFYCCAVTEQGVKERNEDAVLIDNIVLTEGTVETEVNKPFIAAVCDGVSGEKSGDIASKMCLAELAKQAYSSQVNLTNEISRIHKQLQRYGTLHKNSSNMQTTICGIAVDEEQKICCMNVGDSRLYRFRDSKLKQLSKDQSLVEMLYEQGKIGYEEKRNHAHRNIIMPVLGNTSAQPNIDVNAIRDPLEHGDVFLICSDGLSDYIVKSEIEEVLSMPMPMMKRLEEMVKRSLNKGCRDNISVVAVTYMP
jgi:protein phosphatase